MKYVGGKTDHPEDTFATAPMSVFYMGVLYLLVFSSSSGQYGYVVIA